MNALAFDSAYVIYSVALTLGSVFGVRAINDMNTLVAAIIRNSVAWELAGYPLVSFAGAYLSVVLLMTYLLTAATLFALCASAWFFLTVRIILSPRRE